MWTPNVLNSTTLINFFQAMLRKILWPEFAGGSDPEWEGTLRAYTNNVVPDGSSTAGFDQFNESAVTGLGDSTMAFTPPSVNEDGLYHTRSVVTLTNGDATATETFYGWAVKISIDDSARDTWIAEKFAAPITVGPGSSITLIPNIALQTITGTAVIDI